MVLNALYLVDQILLVRAPTMLAHIQSAVSPASDTRLPLGNQEQYEEG